MWPFSRRRSRVLDEIEARIPSRLADIDFSTNDAVIKLWLSESLLDAIDLLSDTYDKSRPDVLRWILFEHAFGRVEFSHLLRSRGRPTPVIHAALRRIGANTSRQEDCPSKATEDIKLHLPAALKEALQSLADSQAKPLSDYLRGVLQQTLFGAGSVRFSRRRSVSVAQGDSTLVRRAA